MANEQQPEFPYNGIFAIPPPQPAASADIEADGGKWVRLADNRIVEYFVCGSTQPDSTILVDCAGGGCSGTMLGRLPGVKEWLVKHNVQAISPSYPGFGRSTVKPGWTIAEWPQTDLGPILEQEGVTEEQSFIVIGCSFGTPHAQAVALHFGQRILALGMRVPFIGRPASAELGLPLGQANMRYTSKSANTTIHGNMLGKAFMSICSNPAAFMDEPSGVQRMFIQCLQPRALEQIAELNHDHADVMQSVKEEMSRGVVCTTQGWLYMCGTDTLLDHGFDVRDIGQNIPVVIWYAVDDEDCPPSHGEWLIEHFEAQSRVFSGTGHAGAAFVDYEGFLEQVLSVCKE